MITIVTALKVVFKFNNFSAHLSKMLVLEPSSWTVCYKIKKMTKATSDRFILKTITRFFFKGRSPVFLVENYIHKCFWRSVALLSWIMDWILFWIKIDVHIQRKHHYVARNCGIYLWATKNPPLRGWKNISWVKFNNSVSKTTNSLLNFVSSHYKLTLWK